jgi:hypothetical protein
MSEQQLKDFGARAETLVEIPDFAGLEQRGRHLRMCRRAGVAAALAAVVAVGGVVITQTHRNDTDTRPVNPPPSVNASPYPGVTMSTLTQGRYWMAPAWVPGHSLAEYPERPLVEFTLPKGWNAWSGPNKFDGHAPGRTNSEALDRSSWYVGVLALQVTAVNTHGCDVPDVGKVSTPATLTEALTHTFGFKVIQAPEQGEQFGYPASHLRVRITRAVEECRNANVFDSASDGLIQYAGVGWIADIWVVDVDGFPVYVQKIWSPNAPDDARSELDGVIDSLRFTQLE